MIRLMHSATLPWLALGLATCLSSLANPAAARNADDFVVSRADCKLQAKDAVGYRVFAACEAETSGLPPQIAVAVIEIESGFNPDAKGADGEIGLMQVMPPTAQLLGFKGSDVQLADPAENIKLGVSYLAQAHRLSRGDLCTTLMKYRAGHKQTRFSARSVAYCLKARKILSREGYQVSGAVPLVNLGSKEEGRSGSVKSSIGVNGCSRRIIVPGPLFQKCADVPSVRVTRFTSTPRKAN